MNPPLDQRRNLLGILLRVEEENIVIQMETEEVIIPFSQIEKANVNSI